MAWVQKREWRQSPSGIPYAVTIRVWVPDKTYSPSMPASSAPARAAVAKKNAAQAKANAARAKALARRRMWSTLQQRAAAIRDNIQAPRKPLKLVDPKAEANEALRERAALIAKKNGKTAVTVRGPGGAVVVAKTPTRDQQRWMAEETKYAAQDVKVKQKLDLQKAKGAIGTKAGGTALERLLREARSAQVKSGGKNLDTAFVQSVHDLYEQHGITVGNKLRVMNERLNTFVVLQKDGTYRWRNANAQKDYYKVLNSPGYKSVRAEHDRLFGDNPVRQKDGSYKTNGEYSKAMTAAGQIADSQRNWIREAAKTAFMGSASGEVLANRRLQWAKQEIAYQTIEDIDPNTTSMITVRGKDGKVTMRHRTPKEEYDFRRAQYEAEMSRRQKEYQNKVVLPQTMANLRQEWTMQTPQGAAAARRSVLLSEAALRLSPQSARDPDFFKNRDNVEAVVDEAMRDWETKNKRLYQTGKVVSGVTVDGMTPEARAKFFAARKEARKGFFDSLQMQERSFIDKLAGAPIIRPTMATLGGIAALPPVLLRMVTHGLTGSSTIEFGNINTGDVPLHIRQKMEQAIKDKWKYLQEHPAPIGGGPRTDDEHTAQMAAREVLQKWLTTSEGQVWHRKFQQDKTDKTEAQNAKFLNEFYRPGGDMAGNLMKRLDALQEFGAEPTNNALVNMGIGIIADPTVAFPLKFTTWGARFAHAVEATSELNRSKAILKGFVEFQKVTEPELRFEKFLSSYVKDVKAGVDPKVVKEQILARLAGIKEGGARDKAAQEFLKSLGVNPNTTSGHAMMTAVQEALNDYLTKSGVTSRTVMERAKEAQKAFVAEEAAKKAALSPAATVVDARQAVREGAARAQAEAKLAESRVRHAEAITEATEELHLARTAPPPLETRVLRQDVHVSPGHVEPAALAMHADDPLRVDAAPIFRDVSLGESLRQGAEESAGVRLAQRRSGEVYVPDAGQRAATIHHVLTGSQDIVYHEGEAFAPGPYTDAFLASDEFTEIQSILARKLEPAPRVPQTAEQKAVRAGEIEERASARLRLYEAGRESEAIRRREMENIGREGRQLEKGAVPYQKGDKTGKYYVVAGGRQSGHQYIPSTSDAALRAGAGTGAVEIHVAELRQAVENVQRRITTLKKYRKVGKLTEEQYQTELNNIRLLGVYRRHSDVGVDLANGDGMLVSVASGNLDHVRAGIPDFIPIGDAMVEDFEPIGKLNHYYESLSLLPEMMRGVGYETPLMGDILNPSWRTKLDFEGFQQVLMDRFQMAVDLPTPGEFRANAAHLFALFHLTALDADDALAEIRELRIQLQQRKITPEQMQAGIKAAHAASDGSMDRLYAYGLAMDALAVADPSNIYARMWKVMETRAGVWWADGFAEGEAAFVDTILRYGHPLHPNLALGMIPYGPIARTQPIKHGFVHHMRNFATSTSGMFKASPARWDDNVVVDMFGVIANPKTSSFDAISVASQIAHYVGSRYGNSLRRRRFQTVLHHHAIEATGRFRNSGQLGLREYERFKGLVVQQYLSEFPQASREAAEKAFERQFSGVLAGGKKRREFSDFAEKTYMDLYWRGKVTHDNAGLHTAMFFEKMGDPKLQRGDSWLHFANEYFEHMTRAGAVPEAQAVLKTMFEQRISMEARSAWESILGADASAPLRTNSWRGGVKEFFIKADLLPSMERIVAQGKRDLVRAQDFATLETDLAAMRNELLIEDDVLREQQRVFAASDDITSMYDMATVEHVADESVRFKDDALAAAKDRRILEMGRTQFDDAVDEMAAADEAFDDAVDEMAAADEAFAAAARRVRAKGTDPTALADLEKAALRRDKAVAKAQRLARRAQAEDRAIAAAEAGKAGADEALAKMGVGTHKLSPRRQTTQTVKRPMNSRMKAYHKRFRSIQFEHGRAEALKYIEGLPEDAKLWMRVEVREIDAVKNMNRLLRTVVHRTIDMSSIPVHVGEQMEVLVAAIKTMPGGEAVLKDFANEYYAELLRSRLIDYIKHEDWFVWQGKQVGDESVVVGLTKQMSGLSEQQSAIEAKLLQASDAAKPGLQKKLDDLTEQRAAIEAQRDEAIAARPEAPRAEGAVPGALPPQEQVPIYGPHPEELNSPRIAAAQHALEILQQMDEKQWLNEELYFAQRKLQKTVGPNKTMWFNRVRDIRKAQRVIEVAESGGPFITPKSRRSYVKGVLSTTGERAKSVIAPGRITPYVVSAAGIEVEQGRALRVVLQNSVVDDALLSRVAKVGETSPIYKRHGKRIEAAFDTPISTDLLVRYGFPEDLMTELTPTQLVTGLDEFDGALDDPNFAKFVEEFTGRMDERIRTITKDPGYGLEQWLQDRLTLRGDHFPARQFEAVEQEVSNAISKEKQGFRRNTRTDLARAKSGKTGGVMAESVEKDVRAVIAKAKVLSAHGIDVHAYNEARKVLRRPLLKKRYAQQIVGGATEAASQRLIRAGHRVEDADWDTLFKQAYDEEFELRRTAMAEEESLKLLDQLAYEMHGAPHTEVIAEFERRYAFNKDVVGEEKVTLTPYQLRTVEEATKTFLNVTDLDNPSEMLAALSAHGQAPPFDNRQAMVDWLTKYGFWSPRTGDEIAAAGSKSWDIFTESKYYSDRWGSPPPWADPTLFEEGAPLNYLLHDEVERGAQFRAWGLFNRNMKARFESATMSRSERARFLVEAHEELGLKAKRDLPMERQYVIDRYGPLAYDEKTGKLIAFPELMHRDELREYIVTRTKNNAFIADDMFDDVETLDIFHALLDKYVSAMVDGKYLAGDVVEFDDVYEMAAHIVHDMMQNPIWNARPRDQFGKFLRGQAQFRRSLVMTQLPFAGTNIVDTGIKAGWSRFTTRAFHVRPAPERALAYGLTDWGFKLHGQLLVDVPVAGIERMRQARGAGPRFYMNSVTGEVVQETVAQRRMAEAVQVGIGITEVPASVASGVENMAKLRLAQGMYGEVYARTFAKLGDPDLADAAAREFIGKEVNRLWPTMGDGPIENLFNQISPFISYQAKNRLLWLNELAGHPAVFNYLNKIGDFIEAENRKRWRQEGTEDQHTDVEARRIELPWSPGTFIDIGSWSDAQAGLKPFYDIVNGKATVGSLASQFVRLASANDVNLVFGLMNALDFGTRLEWVQEKGADGYYTGVWKQVEVKWEAPWGGEANWLNSFWPVETAHTIYEAALDGKFSVQEVTQLAYQTVFFGGITQHDKGAGLQSYFFALKDKDPALAQKWLDETKEGSELQTYWAEKMPKTYAWNPQEVMSILNPKTADPNPWFHSQTPEFQAKVKHGLDDLAAIQKKWSEVLWDLTPGSKAYADAKNLMRSERLKYYSDHPEMYDFFAFSMSPSDWAKQMDEWTTDDLVSTYYQMEAPKADDYKTAVAWQKAVTLWRQKREAFLAANPKVAEQMARSRSMIESVWRQTEEHWFDVLDRIGTRSVAIEAAKQSKDFALTDQLYLANELDYAQLNEDVSVSYFDPTTDFNPLEKDMQGPLTLRTDPFGNQLLRKVRVLPDFNKWRYDRADPAGKAKIERDTKYAMGMKDVIAVAKKSKNFGATFVKELRKHPELLAEYFRRNPGKREQWGATDSYIKQISKFGLLAKAGKFDEAHRYFENLPDWVKARYYSKHPEKRARAAQNLQYMNYMKRWTDHYRKRDYEGGAAFFESMPKWVKDRYYTKHPQGFGRGNAKGTSAYAKAMGKWVDMLQGGDKDAAMDYFDSLPKAYKDRYYAGHPDQKLRADIKRTGQLAQYFGADDANRAQYLKDNPEFGKWLAAQGDSAQTRRLLITEAYRAIPKEDQFLKRIFREKYPEVFSQQAIGEQSLKKTYAFLVEHPDMMPGFEKWLAEVWASYAENLKHTGSRPKPLEMVHQKRMMGNQRPHGGKSAAWVRLHSL